MTSQIPQVPDGPHLSPPFIVIPGVFNCRPVPLPYSGKPWLLRSGDISRLTPAGVLELENLHVKTIFDFRSPSDVVKFKSPVKHIPGIQTVKAPLDLDTRFETVDEVKGGGFGQYESDYMRENLERLTADEAGTWVQWYHKYLTSGKDGIGAVLRRILERKGDDAILFHCSAGKDRTGVMTALALLLAGTEDETIIEDYAMTTVGLAPYKYIIATMFQDNEAVRANPLGAERLLGSSPNTMRAFIQHIRDTWGGAEGYLRDVQGFNEDEIEDLKKVLKGTS
ncbi:hypothetical protein M422DRAFT_40898 [Sphaerobolus stellatus SS14]|nr:hypothetical protein M422DRAFT_40898 [Sphaerobolus stellatus SS14]